MTAVQPKKDFSPLARTMVCALLIFSFYAAFFWTQLYTVELRSKHQQVLRSSQTIVKNQLHPTTFYEGSTSSYNGEESVAKGEGKYPMHELLKKSHIGKRDLGLKDTFKKLKKKVKALKTNPKPTPQMTPTTKKLPWLKRVASAMKVRVRRGIPQYRQPNRARAMNLKKPFSQGEKSIDDSYFLGPDTSCKIPEGLQTVDIRCKMWPTYTRCISYCVYASTFDEGIQREHSCKFKENKWSRDFEECKPFVNCKVQLQSPGNVKCFDNELSTKPHCEIFCQIHEDKDEVKAQTYYCNANATWSPPLPFCAHPREHVTLAKAPKVIEHSHFKYPEAMKH